jgi:hypothetical protein
MMAVKRELFAGGAFLYPFLDIPLGWNEKSSILRRSEPIEM